jgi:4-carboxymuconolactone decarboxylase
VPPVVFGRILTLPGSSLSASIRWLAVLGAVSLGYWGRALAGRATSASWKVTIRFHATRVMEFARGRGEMVWSTASGDVWATVRFQETLRRLAMIDEGFVQDEAGLGLDPAATTALDPKTAALLQVAVSVAIGSSAVCLEWSAGRALAAGASEDEIADVLLAIAPVAGLGRVVCAAPDVATALGYDIAAALEEPDSH